MLSNYFKITIRNIIKQKFYSFINILGLTTGIACSLLIGLYIIDELQYDQFHTKGNQMYRMNLHGKLGGQEVYTTSTSGPMAEALVEEIPEVAEATRIWERGDEVFRYKDAAFTEKKTVAADSNFFDVFSFALISGDPSTALSKPNSVVLTQSVAKKYFSEGDGVGELMTIGNEKDTYTVTGVMEDVPGNSHLKFSALFSMNTYDFPSSGQWLSNSFYTYYVLNEGAEAATVDEKLLPIVDRNVTPALKQFLGRTLEEFKQDGGIYQYFSLSLHDIHLRSTLQDEPEPPEIWPML